MITSRDSAAWRRLGAMLIQRRTAIDPRFHSRGAFCEATGLKYRLVYDIEEAKRANFGDPTLAAIETAYRLEPGAIAAFLGGSDVPALGLPLASVPDDPEDDDVYDLVSRMLEGDLEEKIWAVETVSRKDRLAVILALRGKQVVLAAELAAEEGNQGAGLTAAST